MDDLNYICRICGIEYEGCPACKDVKTYNPWKKYAHDTNCFKIFMILKDSANNEITNENAKQLLSRCDLSKMDTFYPMIITQINEIMDKKN